MSDIWSTALLGSVTVPHMKCCQACGSLFFAHACHARYTRTRWSATVSLNIARRSGEEVAEQPLSRGLGGKAHGEANAEALEGEPAEGA